MLDPDLVITFSDVQSGITQELIARGLQVLALNHRTIKGIADAVRWIARLGDRRARGEEVAAQFLREVEKLRFRSEIPPRIHFEEWDHPMVSGIEWVDQTIALVGGNKIFPAQGKGQPRERIVSPEEVIFKDPEIILASWCGKAVDLASIRGRPGWDEIDAVRNEELYAIDSAKI